MILHELMSMNFLYLLILMKYFICMYVEQKVTYLEIAKV